MGDAISGIPERIEQGSKFTYANFSSKSPRGFSIRLFRRLAGMDVSRQQDSREDGTIAYQRVDRARPWYKFAGTISRKLPIRSERIAGGSKSFRRTHSGVRTVALGHNSPEQTGALEKIDELVDAVNQANDLPITPEEREQLVAELSAGRRLLEASIVRLAALRATMQPALRWILERAAGTIVAKIAGGVWDFFTGLHWL
jgi:hypothetical protein